MHPRALAAASLAAFVLAACGDGGDDGGGGVAPTGPFDLTFRGDATFTEPHGGQTLRMVLVRDGDGTVVATERTTVSGGGDPSFSFALDGVLEEGSAYRLLYWIDSNFGGGAEGRCDAPAVDHQWEIGIAPPGDDVAVEETHRPGETTPVCALVTADLRFTGDASFAEPHGGQTLRLAVVQGDGSTIRTASGSVTSAGDATFSFDFAGLLLLGESYRLDYWIDSNFGGGSADHCDPPEIDHQWGVDVGTATGDVVVEETHRPGDTRSVCSTFAADLLFRGDDTFHGAHGGHAIYVGLVRRSDGTVVERAQGTISGTDVPSFEFDLRGALRPGTGYDLDYWIDSNFPGGDVGECDDPATDHQWRIGIPPTDDDVTIEDSHRPEETTDVCATFASDAAPAPDASP